MKGLLPLALSAGGLMLLAGCGVNSVPETADDSPPPTGIQLDFEAERQLMVSAQIESRGMRDVTVLEAMRRVPRHLFVPDEFKEQAYADHPLPIGYGQTISQPYIVAVMTESLKLNSDMRVLEIGTGSGYQAAVLAELVDEVYTVEIIEPLAHQAEVGLADLGYDNVHVLRADGYFGWESFAPFDAIIVTAAPDHVPQPLVLQLSDNGRMIIPVGPVGAYQQLWLFSKENGELQPGTSLGGVLFVPFTRE